MKKTKIFFPIVLTSITTILITTHCSAQEYSGIFQCSLFNNFAETEYNTSNNNFKLLQWRQDDPIFGAANGLSAQERCSIVSQKLESNRLNNTLNYIVPGYLYRRNSNGTEARQAVLCASALRQDSIIECPEPQVILTLPSENYNQFTKQIFDNLEFNNMILRSQEKNILQARPDNNLVININTLIASLRQGQNQQNLFHQYSIDNSQQRISNNQQKLCETAQSFSVKVIKESSWGSGVIVQKQGNRYFILTNNHVLEENKHVYPVETHDGQYNAEVIQRFTAENQGNNDLDLAILQFNSSFNYPVVPLNKWSMGDQVIAAGFPNRIDNLITNKGLYCTPMVNISLNLEKPMKRGYQLGYPLSVLDGMSGGALLDENGNLVGINGRGQPTLFVNPELFSYRDGSIVDKPLNFLSSLSWAIPIENIVNNPQLQLLGLNILPSAPTSTSQNIILPVTPVWDNLIKRSLVMINNPNQINDIGFSNIGFIIKNEGNNYYVLTSAESVNDSNFYEIRTLDNQNYSAELLQYSQEKNLALYLFSSRREYTRVSLKYTYNIDYTNVPTETNLYFAKWVNLDGSFRLTFFPKNQLQQTTNNSILLDESGDVIGIYPKSANLITVADIFRFLPNNF